MEGNRVDWQPNADDWPFPALKPGEYGKDEDGLWYCVRPGEEFARGGAQFGVLGNLGAHEVEEHGNGTITVSPSILISDGQGWSWHGFLERGVWRKC
jgi:hypothetical protein